MFPPACTQSGSKSTTSLERRRAPAAVPVADGRDPGARAALVDGDADGLEAEPAGVCAGEHRGADDVPAAAPAVATRQRVARGRREQRAAAGGRVEDEDAGEDLPVDRVREEEDEAEAEVDVLDGEAASVVDGEARHGGCSGVAKG